MSSALPHAPNSREKILDVAEARFAQRGFAGVGLREVAAAAGLGKSSLFHHFASKAALYLAVLERVIGRLRARLLPLLAAPGSPLARLQDGLDTLVDELAEHPTTARLLLRGLFEDDALPAEADAQAGRVEALLGELLERLQSLIQEGVDTGAFRPVSPAHTLQTLIGATVYHFASGEFGEGLLGGPLFSAEAVRRRKHEIRAWIDHGLAAPAASAQGGRTG